MTDGAFGPGSSLATVSYVLPGITEHCGKQSQIWLVWKTQEKIRLLCCIGIASHTAAFCY